jgi:hypothetical protein
MAVPKFAPERLRNPLKTFKFCALKSDRDGGKLRWPCEPGSIVSAASGQPTNL